MTKPSFILDGVNVFIDSIAPKTVIDNYEGLTGYVKEVDVSYSIPFKDVTFPDEEFKFSYGEVVNVEAPLDSEFTPFNELRQGCFLGKAEEAARNSKKLSELVKLVLVRQGDIIEPPRETPPNNWTKQRGFPV
jgi:hypothetical protein